MIVKTLLPLVVVVAVSVHNVHAQEFKPSGSPYARVFFNFHSGFDGKSAGFEIQRSYLGYQHQFSENLSGDINFDVGKSEVKVTNGTETTSLHMTAYLKTAALIYKKGKFQADMGMIGLKQFKVQEKHWGFRYIEKSFQDLYGLGTSADMGISAEYKFNPFFSADLTIRNGEGYKKMQSDEAFNTGIGLTLMPLKGLTLRGFYDYIKKEETQRTVAHFIGFQNNRISTGIEYNLQLDHKNQKDRDLYGYSIYTSYKINDNFKAFGRYDDLYSNEINGETMPWNQAKDGSFIISGIEYTAMKNVQIALNYQGWMPDDKQMEKSNLLYVNFHYSF